MISYPVYASPLVLPIYNQFASNEYHFTVLLGNLTGVYTLSIGNTQHFNLYVYGPADHTSFILCDRSFFIYDSSFKCCIYPMLNYTKTYSIASIFNVSSILGTITRFHDFVGSKICFNIIITGAATSLLNHYIINSVGLNVFKNRRSLRFQRPGFRLYSLPDISLSLVANNILAKVLSLRSVLEPDGSSSISCPKSVYSGSTVTCIIIARRNNIEIKTLSYFFKPRLLIGIGIVNPTIPYGFALFTSDTQSSVFKFTITTGLNSSYFLLTDSVSSNNVFVNLISDPNGINLLNCKNPIYIEKNGFITCYFQSLYNGFLFNTFSHSFRVTIDKNIANKGYLSNITPSNFSASFFQFTYFAPNFTTSLNISVQIFVNSVQFSETLLSAYVYETPDNTSDFFCKQTIVTAKVPILCYIHPKKLNYSVQSSSNFFIPMTSSTDAVLYVPPAVGILLYFWVTPSISFNSFYIFMKFSGSFLNLNGETKRFFLISKPPGKILSWNSTNLSKFDYCIIF